MNEIPLQPVLRQTFSLFAHLLVVVCSFFCIKLMLAIIIPDQMVTQNFIMTNCQILTSKITTNAHAWLYKYRTDFLVKYNVQDHDQLAWSGGSGIRRDYFFSYQQQLDSLNKFKVGEIYPCWYDPNNRDSVALVVKYNWLSTLALTIPILTGCIGAVCLKREIYHTYYCYSIFNLQRQKRKALTDKKDRLE